MKLNSFLYFSSYYLERACQDQVLALQAAGGDVTKLSKVDPEVAKRAGELYTSPVELEKYARKHFFSWWNRYRREEPEVFE